MTRAVAPKDAEDALGRAGALRERVERVLGETRLVGFLSLQLGLTPDELERAEAVVLTVFADYRKLETGQGGGRGFYELRA